MSEAQFGGRMVLRDGTAEADLVIDIDDETVSLLQGDQLLGQYPLDEIHFLRWSRRRIILSIAGRAPTSIPTGPTSSRPPSTRSCTPIGRNHPAFFLPRGVQAPWAESGRHPHKH